MQPGHVMQPRAPSANLPLSLFLAWRRLPWRPHPWLGSVQLYPARTFDPCRVRLKKFPTKCDSERYNV